MRGAPPHNVENPRAPDGLVAQAFPPPNRFVPAWKMALRGALGMRRSVRSRSNGPGERANGVAECCGRYGERHIVASSRMVWCGQRTGHYARALAFCAGRERTACSTACVSWQAHLTAAHVSMHASHTRSPTCSCAQLQPYARLRPIPWPTVSALIIAGGESNSPPAPEVGPVAPPVLGVPLTTTSIPRSMLRQVSAVRAPIPPPLSHPPSD